MECNFNTELKRLRKSKGITQEQLADKVGVSPQAVSKWEISSYPDAQLLPAIADALDVTIDELYGRGKEEINIYDRVMESLKAIPEFDDRTSVCFEICRAMIMGIMGCSKHIPLEEMVYNAEDWEQHSEVTNKKSIFQARLNGNLQYFLFMPEPEKGYDKILSYDEKAVELFEFLSTPDALRAMYYVAGRKTTMFFNDKTLACELGIKPEQAREIIQGMLKFKFIWEADFNAGNENEKIYQYLSGCNFVSFLTFTRTLLNRPYSFNYQTNSRDEPFFKNDTYKNINQNKK